jgi:hypothetical protein
VPKTHNESFAIPEHSDLLGLADKPSQIWNFTKLHSALTPQKLKWQVQRIFLLLE